MSDYPDYIMIPSFELLSSPQIISSGDRQELIDFMMNWHWEGVIHWEENVLFPCLENKPIST